MKSFTHLGIVLFVFELAHLISSFINHHVLIFCLYRCHFEEMAKTLKQSSSSDFASYVLTLSQEQYSVLLKDYYSTKHPQLDLAQLYEPPKQTSEEQTQHPPSQRKQKDRGKLMATNKPCKKNARGRGKGSVHQGCQFESLSEDDNQRKTNRTKKDDRRKGNKQHVVDDVEDKVKPSTSKVMSTVCIKRKGKQSQIRTKPNEREAVLESSLKNEKSVDNMNHASSHVDDSDDDWLLEDINQPNKKTDTVCQHCQTQHRNRRSCDKRCKSSSCYAGMDSDIPSLHKEENLSFLDDIFLVDRSNKPHKPPPKKKSPRAQAKTTIFVVKGDLSDSDIEMADLSDMKSSGMCSSETDRHKNMPHVSDTLWKRNSKFTTRQSVLEQASIEAKLENRSVFEKYAESFVQNEHFRKRDLNKEPDINIEETLTTSEDDCTEAELRPSMSCIAETSSF